KAQKHDMRNGDCVKVVSEGKIKSILSNSTLRL
ncbi:MAG: hypothetical protein ACI81T_002857, partial [Bacteroidia bacterium]